MMELETNAIGLYEVLIRYQIKPRAKEEEIACMGYASGFRDAYLKAENEIYIKHGAIPYRIKDNVITLIIPNETIHDPPD